MPNFVSKFTTKTKDFFAKMEKPQKTRFFVLVFIVVALMVTALVLLNQKSYSVLYSGMNPEDAGQVLSVLQEMNVDAKTQGSDTILVEKGAADKVRMELAGQGYPASGFNYDIFANASGLGTTDLEKKVYLQFQLQENIRRTLIKMDKVEDAVVNINLPEDSLFVIADNNRPATAAVMLMLKKGQDLGRSEVRAIGELVSKTVPGLDLEDVRIVDSQMNLYEVAEKDGHIGNATSQMELQQTVKNNLQQQVISLLNPIFGEGNILAEVNVQLDFDKETQESVEFSPPVDREEGLVASLSELTENMQNSGNAGVAGMDPNGAAPQYPATDGSDGTYERVSRDVTMRINETKTLIEKAQGQIKDLSVAVILDSGQNIMDYTDNIKEIVAGAIGVNEERVAVQTLPFWQGDKSPEDTDAVAAFQEQHQLLKLMESGNTRRIIIISISAILIMIMLLFMIRVLKKEPELQTIAQEEMAAGIHMVADEPVGPDTDLEELAKIDFETEDTELSQLEGYIDKNPEAVAQLLKSWLADD